MSKYAIHKDRILEIHYQNPHISHSELARQIHKEIGYKGSPPRGFRRYVSEVRENTTMTYENPIVWDQETFGTASTQQWLVLSDNHKPFDNKTLENKVLQLIKDMGTSLYGVVLAGDYLDLYTLGSYNAESLGLLTGIDLEMEYIEGRKGIEKIENASHKDLKKKYLFGNHEDRYFRELNKKDNAKYGRALKNPIEALELDERGWEVKTNWKDDYFTLGNHLDVMHGTYHNIHAAYNHLTKTRQSCIFGHTHRVQSYNIGNRAAYNIGGLYDLNSTAFHYMPRLQREVWANGFAIVHIDDNGYFFVDQINIWDDRFIANGKMY